MKIKVKIEANSVEALRNAIEFLSKKENHDLFYSTYWADSEDFGGWKIIFDGPEEYQEEHDAKTQRI